MLENKIELGKVIKYFGKEDYDFDVIITKVKNCELKIGKEKFAYQLMLDYTQSRVFIESILALVVEDDYIAYAQKEAYTLLMVLKMCTNIDVEKYETNLNELIKLPYDVEVRQIINYLKSLDEYDYIDALLREVDMRITQEQHRLNNVRKMDKIVDPLANMLTEMMMAVKPEDINGILEVVKKLEGVSQKDIINKVLEINQAK